MIAARAGPSPSGGHKDGKIGDEHRQVGGERGRPGDIIDPAGLEGDGRAEGGGVDDRPPGDGMMRRHPGEGQSDDQHEQPEQGEEQGAERPEPVVERARQGEDARTDHAVERQEGRAGEADVAAEGFVLRRGHSSPLRLAGDCADAPPSRKGLVIGARHRFAGRPVARPPHLPRGFGPLISINAVAVAAARAPVVAIRRGLGVNCVGSSTIDLPRLLSRRLPRPVTELVVGVGMTAVFVGLRLAIIPLVGEVAPFALSIIAVLLAALVGGWRARPRVDGAWDGAHLVFRPAGRGSFASRIRGRS